MARGSSGPSLPPLKVNFPRQMKIQRIYPVRVSWQGGDGFRTGGVRQVTLRLLMAGGQVLPVEQTLETSSDAVATFYVTPLGRGWLREQRLEVVVQGRKVQEIPLASKVTSHCWTKFFVLMMFVAPWLLGWMQQSGPNVVADLAEKDVPALPALVSSNVPALAEGWEKAWNWAGETYSRLWWTMSFSPEQEPRRWGFPAVCVFGVLALLSLWWHRDTRRRRTGPPVPLADNDD
jgi:hypothetical protein